MVNGNGNGHPVTPEELIAQLRESVERLPESGLGRADLKMLSKSFREMVHAFRRFEAMRDLRKVTVFGSARCKPGSPKGCASQGARCITHDLWEELGRQIHVFLSSVSLADVVEKRVLGRAQLGTTPGEGGDDRVAA